MEFASNEDLGRYLSDMIDQMESQRLFAGDLEGVFTVPLEDGSEYEVTVRRSLDPAKIVGADLA